MTNLLFIADVIGSPGRDVLHGLLPELKRRHDIHLVICNCENSAAGFGVTKDVARELFAVGCDVLTGGNHLWDKKDAIEYIGDEPRLVRPANLPPGTPGEGFRVFKASNGASIGVVNLLGRVFMREADCPFRTMDAGLETWAKQTRNIFVDFHAETTAEKIALGWHLDGRVSAVIGTHTHVQTADDRILPGGTACLTDAGMTGGFESVIGMDRTAALRRFLTLMPERLTPATGDLRLNAVLLSVDEATGKTQKIQRLQIPFTRATAENSRPDAGGARLLTGAEPAEATRIEAKIRARVLIDAGITPRLALVSVGEDPASQVYLKKKHEACADAGIEVERVQFPAGSTTEEIVKRVRQLGADPSVHGILVQLPLAAPAKDDAVLDAIPPIKDVDGFHPENAGRLAVGLPCFIPATPFGVLRLLQHYEIPIKGKHAVVLGRSHIVGRPMATLLSSKPQDMTVTIGHSGSKVSELMALSRQADVLVAAVGKRHMVTADWVKPGAVVIDVGIHRDPPAPGSTKSRITGDVEFESVRHIASAITPVPGGVGPMTVALVVLSTIIAAERQSATVKV
ncbi:MAG: TIGR00282 family metallophosphoesterase [Candidatus Eisenbacteria bacterium]